MRTERYWNQKLFQSRDRIDSAYNSCLGQFANMAGGLGFAGTDTGTAASTYEAARSALHTAVVGQQQLEEDARRAGVPPGWVRFDWSRYPELKWGQDVSTARTDTRRSRSSDEKHPCSVPDILRDIHY